MAVARNGLNVAPYKIFFTILFFIIVFSSCSKHNADCDWSMWRYDPNRSAASPQELPDELYLKWERHYTPRTAVWDDPLNQDIMPYDRIFEPVVMGKTMFIGFNDYDKVVALGTETGEEKWSFHTDGPIRFPPVAWKGKVFFTSDDGCLYCVDASRGKLNWKFRGGPSDRKILGNKRLISVLPARGGPVLKDGTVYFAAGILPFMGTFIYALDAETGEIVWINDGTGSQYILQPHNSPAFAGVAPQGALAAVGDKLLVPGGRSVPACFDRHTGKFLYYKLAASGKTGGSFVCAAGNVFFNYHREKITSVYNLANGDKLIGSIGQYPVLSGKTYYLSGDSITALDAEKLHKHPGEWEESVLWKIKADASNDLIKAGHRLYAAGKRGITAINFIGERETPEISWTKKIDGQVERLLAADNKLFAVTLEGQIMAFGSKKAAPKKLKVLPNTIESSDEISKRARSILKQTGVNEGYALLYGISGSDFCEALLQNSKLHIICVDPNSNKVDTLRRRFADAGLYGKRIAVHVGNPHSFQAPPYIASLTIIDDPVLAGCLHKKELLEDVFYSMRPYGGKLWLNITGKEKELFLKSAARAGLHGLTNVSNGEFPILSREGALANSSDWTHQYGNAANTAKSDDSLVKLPLGVLWFGGNSNLDVLPRHGHGPPEQVIGGRLFIEGMDCLSARDVYTGRVLWKANLDSLGNYGVYYDDTYTDTPTLVTYNQIHIPGANARGANFVAAIDRVYVVQKGSCHVLDSASGKTIKVISLPSGKNGSLPQWGYIGVYKDYLIAGSNFVAFSSLVSKNKKWQNLLSSLTPKKKVFYDFDKTASMELVVMERNTGDILWRFEAENGFIHNGIAVGSDKIFCLDKIPPFIEEYLQRRGILNTGVCRLRALDIKTGKILWETNKNIFGTWLSYSKEWDILLQARRSSRDMLEGENGERMIAYNGQNGAVLWDKRCEYSTFPILHGDKIITEGKIFSLAGGKLLRRRSPLTGRSIPWTWKREYGCNYPIASEHLISFRSAAAGFYDLAHAGGTGNFGGFRSGCTSNLIAANGVLNAPDYTRTCQCAYQNQTSLALVHMPEVEIWTFNNIKTGNDRVKRVGINFGAPGDRLAKNGTLWIDFPSVGGPSPDIPVRMEPDNVEWFRHHSSRLDGNGLKWVAASGCKGISSVTITMAKKAVKAQSYTVRLYFAEPENLKLGSRLFDVEIQGIRVLNDFDIISEVHAPFRMIVKEFKNINVAKKLTVTFNSDRSVSRNAPIICGIEAEAEGN